jgi:hypothetical protein
VAQQSKRIIAIVIVMALVLIFSFVFPNFLSSRDNSGTNISPPNSGDRNSCVSKILLDITFSGKSHENFNLSINSNFTAINVEIWNNGTHSFNCSLLNSNGTVETRAKVQNMVFSDSKVIFNKFNHIVYGNWNLSLSSEYLMQGTAIILGDNYR